MFSEKEIERLRLLRLAVKRGHLISTVAALSDAELSALVRDDEAEAAGAAPGATAGGRDTGAPADERDRKCRVFVSEALERVICLDSAGLEKVLNSAMVALPRYTFMQSVLVPMFEEIGELWRQGKLKIVNEHMASSIVRGLMWDMLRSVRVAKSAPRALIVTPVGHWHELGALASAVVASESGWRAFYFGPDLPSEEIAYAAQTLSADVIILSLSHRLNDSRCEHEVKSIRRLIGEKIPILIGGRGANLDPRMIRRFAAEVVADIRDLRLRLEAICNGK